MTPGELLNSDMSTILAALKSGVDWWLDELKAMVPERWRRDGVPTGDLIRVAADGTLPAETSPTAQVLVVPSGQVLVREIAAPAMSRRDAEAMVALDTARYFPIPEGDLLVSVGTPVPGDNGLTVPAAAMLRSLGETMAVGIAETRVRPLRIMAATTTGGVDPRFDFLPAMRDADLVPKRKSRAALWWAVVAFLFALNLAMIVWRDVAATDRMEDAVAAQAPAVGIAKRIEGRIRRNDRLVADAARHKREGGPVPMLAAVSRSLPTTAWVQRMTWEGRALRIAGFRTPDTDLVAALRRDPAFAKVRNAAGERPAITSNGQPFDVVIGMRR